MVHGHGAGGRRQAYDDLSSYDDRRDGRQTDVAHQSE